MKGNRSWGAIARAPLRRGHYRGLVGAFRVYGRPVADLRRFLTAGGSYPYSPRLRTPIGPVTPTLDTSHDMSTVHEIFARRDYAAGPDLRLAVDFGSNIGISALYFLSRSATARAVLFEPDPRNVARLRSNLRGLEDRYELQEVAVGLADGRVDFGIEPTGRYGGIGVEGAERISVECREVNAVLEEVLAVNPSIDVLKIDVEGLETDLVAAIRPELLARIATIYYETDHPEPLHADRFDHHFDCQTNRLRNLELA